MKKSRWFQTILVPEKKLRDAMELYPGKTREEVRELLFPEVANRLLLGSMIAVVFLIGAVASGKTKTVDTGIMRSSPGGTSTLVQVQLELESGWKTLPVEIGPLEYAEEQIEELHREAEAYLENVVPGENESFDKITVNLNFPGTLPATGGDIYWTTDAPWLISSEGEVLNGDLTGPEEVRITAEISYGSEYRCFSKVVTVYPAIYTGEEAILREVQLELSDWEKATRTSEQVILPESVLGYSLEQVSVQNFSFSAFLVLLAVSVPMLLLSAYFSSLDTRRKERKELVEACYTEFVTKLSMMLAAGISVRQAFGRLADEYEKNQGVHHVLAEELRVTKQELDNGRSETVAYEQFGRRIGVLAYHRMASLLAQNVSKGVQGIRNLLLLEAKEVMAQEKANIRQKGEQAGTKLLLPMMGLLLLVFAILLVPAFQSF